MQDWNVLDLEWGCIEINWGTELGCMEVEDWDRNASGCIEAQDGDALG